MTQKIGVIGGAGRMGRLLISEAIQREGCELGAVIVRSGSDLIGLDASVLVGGSQQEVKVGDDLKTLAKCDVVIDFTTASTTEAMIGDISKLGVPVLIGTTGLSHAGQQAVAAAADQIPVLQASNTSLGVTVLKDIVRRVSKALPARYDIEIIEMHHGNKVDAPSGTALTLGHEAAAGRGLDHDTVADRGRDGHTGPRPENAIGYAVLRGGDVVGEHQVVFAGPGERIEIGHRVSDRSIFAKGAVDGALWLSAQKPGLYTMNDVLGI